LEYIKKSIKVEAEIFLPNENKIPKGIKHQFRQNGVMYGSVSTKGGYFTVKDGDYVVTEPDGEKYSCDADKFKKNFEEI